MTAGMGRLGAWTSELQQLERGGSLSPRFLHVNGQIRRKRSHRAVIARIVPTHQGNTARPGSTLVDSVSKSQPDTAFSALAPCRQALSELAGRGLVDHDSSRPAQSLDDGRIAIGHVPNARLRAITAFGPLSIAVHQRLFRRSSSLRSAPSPRSRTSSG
jgi:hypothetical protein